MILAVLVPVRAISSAISVLSFDFTYKPQIKLVSIVMRIGWLLISINSFVQGASHHATSQRDDARKGFLFITMLHAWASILTSIVEACFSRISPTDKLSTRGPRAYRLFGWYFSWWEGGVSAWKPRERRSSGAIVPAALFWLMTFALKLSIEYAATENIVRSITTLMTLHDIFATASQHLYAGIIILIILLRLGFSLLFFAADLQLFFAASMAVVGGLTAARNSSFGALGGLWERAQGLSSVHMRTAASAVLRRFPHLRRPDGGAISQLILDGSVEQSIGGGDDDPLVEQSALEHDVLQDLWNDGLVRDLIESHLIDIESANKLRIEPNKTTKRAEYPPLSAIMPTLCADARRRIHTFISFCSRRSVPIPSLPSHCPSLTVLVPVYGEVVIRSWHEMFRADSGNLCNFGALTYLPTQRVGRIPDLSCAFPSLVQSIW